MKKILQTIALLTVSFMASLLLVEGFLRLFPGFLPEEAQLKIHWQKIIEDIRSERHPYIGFLYPPNTTGEVSHGDFNFTYTTDEKGFRNSRPWPQSADIVAVGDSMVFGYGVEDDQSWLALLSAAHPELSIVNLGLIGASPQQYYRVYETLGAELKPKVLLYCLFPGNDIRDARLFNDWLEAGRPGNYDVWRFFKGKTPDEQSGVERLLRSSYLGAFIRESLKDIKVSTEIRGKTFELADGNRIRLTPSFVAHAQPESPTFNLILDAIEETRMLAEKTGTQFLVVLVPTKEEIYLPLFGKPTPDTIRPFSQALEERGIAYLDLAPYFLGSAKEGTQLYFEVDGHPNATGYKILADAVKSYLKGHASEYGLTGWK